MIQPGNSSLKGQWLKLSVEHRATSQSRWAPILRGFPITEDNPKLSDFTHGGCPTMEEWVQLSIWQGKSQNVAQDNPSSHISSVLVNKG